MQEMRFWQFSAPEISIVWGDPVKIMEGMKFVACYTKYKPIHPCQTVSYAQYKE